MLTQANLAASKIQALMTEMLRRDNSGNCVINENEVDNVLSNIKTLAGRRRAWRVDREAIRNDFLNSLTKNKATMFIPNSEPDVVETKNSEEREDNELRFNDEEQVQVHVQEKKEKEMQSIMEYSVASSLQQSTQMNPDPEESWTVSNDSNPSYKPPITNNGPLLAKKNRSDEIRVIQATVSNGTVDSPFDIDSILFNGQNMDHVHSE